MMKPKMILFDYGHTLCYEAGFDSVKGNKALLAYAIHNPQQHTAEDISRMGDRLFRDSNIAKAREMGVETHGHMFDRLLYGLLQIEFSLTLEEMEEIFWDASAPGEMMANIDILLRYLRENNIRSGVISNISYSGRALQNRLDRLLTDHQFEFVIASSEYIIRKPDPLIFELALKMANLSADEVWFCGDNTLMDVKGASSAGMYPVWYHSPLPCDYRDKSFDGKPDCEHLYISDWLELIPVLEGLA